MNDLELKQYGDKELWYVSGEMKEGSWSIPLWVFRYRAGDIEYVRICPIKLMPIQAEEIKSLFDDKSIWSKEGVYILEDEDFRKVAKKASGVTPDYYRKWPDVEQGVNNNQQLQVKSWDTPDPNLEGKSFLKYLSQKRGISYNLLKLVWWTICEEAPIWMIGERKPVDLGFVVLYPMPFRANWKEILIAKHPTSAYSFQKPTSERNEELLRSEFMVDVCSGHNIAIDSKLHTVSWHIEAVPQLEWEETNQRIEAMRLASGKKSDYTVTYEKFLRNLLPTILDAMGSYISKISIPFAHIIHSRISSGRIMVPHRGKGRQRKASQEYPVRIVINTKPLQLGNNGQSKPLRQETFDMPPVPSLLQAADDMREPDEQRTVEKQVYGVARAIGVPLPHADEGEDSGESVLPITSD